MTGVAAGKVVLASTDTREIAAAVLAMKVAGRDLKRTINQSTRAKLNEPFRSGIVGRAMDRTEQRVLVPGARIAGGNPPVLTAVTSRRRLSGGLIPTVHGHAVEFGAADTATTYRRTAPGGGVVHDVTRHTRRGLPRRRKKGPVMETVHAIGHRAASLWVQIIVLEYCRAADEAR